MNLVALVGNMVADPEMKSTNSGAVVSFRIAVSRTFKREGKPDSDFFRVTAFGKTAEFVHSYLKKGNKISVQGRIELGSYEKDGVKMPTIDIIAAQVNNLTPRTSVVTNDQGNTQSINNGEVPF